MPHYLGKDLNQQAHPIATFTGDGATTIFTLPYNPGSATGINVYINGLFQPSGYSFTVNNINLIFDAAPPFGNRIDVVYLGLSSNILSSQISLPRTQATGTGDSMVAAFNPPFTTYFENMQMEIGVPSINTVGNPVVAVDAMAAKTIVDAGGNALRPGALVSKHILVYNVAYNGFVCMNPYLTFNNFPAGYIFNMALSNNATTTKLDVAAGRCRDSTDVIDIYLNTPVTAGLIQTSGSWAAGNTQNKLDAGVRANNTWYHVFAIRRDSDGNGDFIFSLSSTSPTLPLGYTKFRRIGAVRTDGSGNIIPFYQIDSEFYWVTPILDMSNGTFSIANRTLYTLSTPTGVRCKASFNIQAGIAGRSNTIYVTTPDAADQVISFTVSPLSSFTSLLAAGGVGGVSARQLDMWTNTSSQIGVIAQSADAGCYIATLGWRDPRGAF